MTVRSMCQYSFGYVARMPVLGFLGYTRRRDRRQPRWRASFALLRSGTFWSHGVAFATALITLTDWRVGGGPMTAARSLTIAGACV
jgi:hypothetical protein